MPMITPMKISKACFDTLVKLNETNSPSQKTHLKNHLCTLKMEKDESDNSLFMNISQIKDHLLAIRVEVDDDDLVQIVIYNLPSSWETFLSIVNGREVQPSFERLWHDYIQEEIQIQGRNGPIKEENISLAILDKQRKEVFSLEERLEIQGAF